MILTCFVTMIHDSASNPDRNKTLTNIYLGKVKKKISTDYTQYCTTLAVHFARQAHLVCELSIDIIYLQTFLRKKIYCFKFATIMKGMFRCKNQIIVPPSFLHNQSPNM